MSARAAAVMAATLALGAARWAARVSERLASGVEASWLTDRVNAEAQQRRQAETA
ncbi:hypothetical protein ABZ918_31885 [Streptomyces viridosporus]|uniref:hypothetical protein n=1 Tax=Streptomyces viridosporus TaxID=67581 RepID=UPI003434BC7E